METHVLTVESGGTKTRAWSAWRTRFKYCMVHESYDRPFLRSTLGQRLSLAFRLGTRSSAFLLRPVAVIRVSRVPLLADFCSLLVRWKDISDALSRGVLEELDYSHFAAFLSNSSQSSPPQSIRSWVTQHLRTDHIPSLSSSSPKSLPSSSLASLPSYSLSSSLDSSSSLSPAEASNSDSEVDASEPSL
jgi:hypothetical protein